MTLALFEQLSLFKLPGAKTPKGEGDAPSPRASKSPAKPPRQRHVHLGNQIVAYTLRQGQRRRRLSLTIDERGLSVGAPGRVSLAEIEAFVHAHAEWVLAKLAEHAGQNTHRHLTVRDGSRLPLLGAPVAVRIVPGANRSRWHEDHLLLEAREGTDSADHANLARRALQRRALALFHERLGHYAGRLGRTPPRLGLSNARTRWGSCSSRTGIRINWRLIHLPLPLIDYVIAHELAHLVEMNHSPRFWAVVESIYPEWEAARRELKLRGREIPIL